MTSCHAQQSPSENGSNLKGTSLSELSNLKVYPVHLNMTKTEDPNLTE